jgi:hypothetical protein
MQQSHSERANGQLSVEKGRTTSLLNQSVDMDHCLLSPPGTLGDTFGFCLTWFDKILQRRAMVRAGGPTWFVLRRLTPS